MDFQFKVYLYYVFNDAFLTMDFKSSGKNKGKKSQNHDVYLYIVLTCGENSYETWRR